MERILILLGLATTVLGFEYNGLRVKYGWSQQLADKEFFFKIPRTISDVESEGWKLTERPPGALPQLKMYCPPGRVLCPLYHPSGFVAGLMIAIPADEFESPKIKPETKFVKWNAPASNGEPARQYWTSTQYYIPDAGSEPDIDDGETLQFGGVWVEGPDGKLLRIPTEESELKNTLFKKQNCIPNMGTHYYYKMTKDLDCEELFPWFGLTNDDQLVGTGFQMVGKLTRPQPREWFDNFSADPVQRSLRDAYRIVPNDYRYDTLTVAPLSPQCFTDWVSQDGLLSMHIYYVNDPWNIKCKSGDSISE